MRSDLMKQILAVGLLILCLAGNAVPQAQMSSGDLKGTVKDSTEAVLPGAAVTVTNMETGVERRTASDAGGSYRFLVLPPGTYELKAEVTGFAAYTRRPIQVTVGQTVIIDPQLQPAGIQQEVIVQEAAPVLETSRIQQSDTVTEERIQNLPINVPADISAVRAAIDGRLPA